MPIRRLSLTLFAACCLLLAVAQLPARTASAAEDAPEALEQEAKAAVDQAFRDFDAKKFREAAQGFLRAYEMTGGKFPKQLRNAAKAYTTGSLYEEAVPIWERLATLPKADDAVRKEAKEQLQAVRDKWADQLKGQADAVHKGKQLRQAADLYVRAWRASGKQNGALLVLAGKAYQGAAKADDAHLAFGLAAATVDAATAKQGKDAAAAVLGEVRAALPTAKTALDQWAAGQFAAAAPELLAQFDAKRERMLLRMAAMSLENAEKYDEALATWSRYELHDPTSLLGTALARERQVVLRRSQLKNVAKAATEAGNHAAAAEAWLAMFDVSQERDVVALREAAQAFERADNPQRAVALWQRLADSPHASESERAAATERAAEVAKAKPKAPGVVVPVQVAVGQPSKPDKQLSVAVVTAPTPQPCTTCWVLAGSGGVTMLAGLALVGLARSDQNALVTAAQSKDGSGKITGVAQQEAATRQDRNVLLNQLGWAGVVGGGVAVAASLWMWQRGPATDPPAKVTWAVWTDGAALTVHF